MVGLFRSFIQQTFAGKHPTWTSMDIPDQTGKVHLITGGSSGLGLETAKRLLEHNASVYILGRNASKAQPVIDQLKKETGRSVKGFIEADLNDLTSVRKAAELFASKEDRLDVLYNNAGVMFTPSSLRTAQGFENQFGINVVSHYHLTMLLMPILIKTSKLTSENSRIVNISSHAHYSLAPNEGILFDQLKPEKGTKMIDEKALYGMSKLGNLILSNQLQLRYSTSGVISIAVHPGNIVSSITRNMKRYEAWTFSFVQFPVELGALNQLFAATAPEADSMGGKYIIPWVRTGPTTWHAQNEDNGEKLWGWLQKECIGF